MSGAPVPGIPATPGWPGGSCPRPRCWPLISPGPAGPLAGVIPPGFVGRVTLTIPAATMLDLADRPGELGGIGPIDPKPKANTSDCYRSQVRADPARRAWRTSSVDRLFST